MILGTFAHLLVGRMLMLSLALESLTGCSDQRRPRVARHPQGPDFHLASHAHAGGRGWKGLNVEVSALSSIIKLLELFGHKRGQLPWLDS